MFQSKDRYYGNAHKFNGTMVEASDVYPDMVQLAPMNCKKLVEKCIHMMNTKFIPICSSYAMNGVIGNLKEDDMNNKSNNVTLIHLPINIVVANVEEIQFELQNDDVHHGDDDYPEN